MSWGHVRPDFSAETQARRGDRRKLTGNRAPMPECESHGRAATRICGQLRIPVSPSESAGHFCPAGTATKLLRSYRWCADLPAGKLLAASSGRAGGNASTSKKISSLAIKLRASITRRVESHQPMLKKTRIQAACRAIGNPEIQQQTEDSRLPGAN